MIYTYLEFWQKRQRKGKRVFSRVRVVEGRELGTSIGRP